VYKVWFRWRKRAEISFCRIETCSGVSFVPDWVDGGGGGGGCGTGPVSVRDLVEGAEAAGFREGGRRPAARAS